MTEQKKDGGLAFPRMSENEIAVLDFLADNYNVWDGNCFPFQPICDYTQLDRPQVRRACRSLARKGLTKFHNGLTDVEGNMAGAGYCCTKLGYEVIQAERNK